MIQILPVESKRTFEHITSSYFKGQEHYYRMEMQDGDNVLGSGDIFIKGDSAYLLALEITEANGQYVVFDSILRSLMNLASHHGAIVFNANELYPLMSYFTKNEFNKIQNFSRFDAAEAFDYYVSIEAFFAKPCKG